MTRPVSRVALSRTPARGIVFGCALVWMLVLTLPYLRISVGSLAHAGYLGVRQAAPTIGVIALLAVGGLLIGLVQRPGWGRAYLGALLGGAGLLVLGAVVLGRTIGAALVVCWLLFLGWVLGDRLIGWCFATEERPRGLLGGVFAVALALGCYSHAMLGAALLGGLRPWIVFVALGLLTVLLGRDVLHKGRLAWHTLARWPVLLGGTRGRWFGLPLGAVLLGSVMISFFEALAPEIQYDSLNYHLQLPQVYIAQGHFVATPYNIQSWFALGAEMNFLLGMLLGGQAAAKLLSFSFLVLTTLGMYAFGRQFLSRRAGLYAAALFATTPLVAWEASTTYIDLILSCYCFLTIAAAYCWLVERRTGWLVVCGLCAAFALSTKINAAFLLLPLGVVLVVAAVLDRRVRWTARLTPLFVLGGVAVVATLPWPLLRYVQTGNPLFPFLNGYFKSSQWPAVNEGFNFATFGIGTSPGALVRLPWAITFDSQKFIEALPKGLPGLGLLALPLLLAALPLRRAASYLLVLLVAFSLEWAFTAQLLRYYLPALPLVYLLLGHALGTIGAGSRGVFGYRWLQRCVRVFVLAWALVALPIQIATYWNIPERIPYGVVFGRESGDAYLSRVLNSYDAYQFLNTHAPKDYHVLTIGDENRLYGQGTMETTNSPFVAPLLVARDDDAAMDLVYRLGLTHLLINRNSLPESLRVLLLNQPAFLDKNTSLEFAGKNTYVYRFLSPSERAVQGQSEVVQLAANGGFEDQDGQGPIGWQGYGSPTFDSTGTKSHTGSAAILATVESGYVQSVPITVGKLYTLRHFSRADAPDSSVRVQINWVDDQSRIVDVGIAVFVVGQDWTEHELTAVAPVGATKAVIFANAHLGRVWLDDVSFTRQR